jgi:hypothetical protein
MRARVGVVAAAVTAAVLAGCGGSDAPEGSPAPSAATSSAAPSAPPLPAAAEGQGPRAAEAFVRHYVDLINHGLETLDERGLAQASAEGCAACQYFIEALKTTRERQGYYEGGDWKIVELTRYPHGVEGEHNVRAQVEISAEKVVHRNPRDVAQIPERRTVYNFIVAQRDGAFFVTRIIGIDE